MRTSFFLSVLFITIPSVFSGASAQDREGSVSMNPAPSLIKEKLYVHTDKAYYMAGEILWLKLYCTDAFLHQPLSLSKLAYVELLDSANKAVQQAKIALNHSSGNGSLFLSAQLPSGNYKLRAYTRWMQNDDPNRFFEKCITVMNLNNLPPIKPAAYLPRMQVGFFPEGGNLVQQLQNRIAFKGSTEQGASFQFTGYLLDGMDTLLRFSPEHSGMGSFLFTPQPGHSYRTTIVPAAGTPFDAPLPEALPTGVVLSADKTAEGFDLKIYSNVPGNQVFQLLVHTRGITTLTTSIRLHDGKACYKLPASILGDGISTLTVFDEAGRPASERLVFKYPAQELNLQLNTPKTVFNTREEVLLSLNTTQKIDSADVSVAVYRIDSLQQAGRGNILSYLLLSSDIRGHIEQPEYYFSARNEKVTHQLDLLLLTQGWRRFKWQESATPKQQHFRFPPELQGHIITGRVMNGTQPAGNTTVYLSAPSSFTYFKTTTSDANGYFRAEMGLPFGTTSLIAQTEQATFNVQIDDPFSTSFSGNTLPPLYRPLQNTGTLLQQSMSMQVQQIYAGEQLNYHQLPAFSDTIPFYKNADQHYQLDNYTRFTTMEEVLREYVNLVDVRFKNKEVNLFVIDPARKAYFEEKPLNLLDGVPVFNFTKFLEFDPMKIQSVDVVAKRYVLGNSVFQGILNWKTYKPSADNYVPEPQRFQIGYEGLQLEREFYSPAYDTPGKKESHLPDFRNVLHWAPSVSLKQDTTFPIRFYTSDLPGKYMVVAEGISGNGLAGTAVLYFDVK
ncbi:MAG: carboxypeptidase-like regulatory domain-containing protein [Chitinophagaceae bacterium]